MLVIQHAVGLTLHARHVVGAQSLGIRTLLGRGAAQGVHPFFQVQLGEVGQNLSVKGSVFLGGAVKVDGGEGKELPNKQGQSASHGGEGECFHVNRLKVSGNVH